jgi:hypothetical protein
MTIRLNWYHQEPLPGLIGSRQMDGVGAVPPAVGETLQLIWVRTDDHNVRAHTKGLAGCAWNRVTRVHVGNAKSLDVLRPSGENILHKLKEDFVETSWIVMLGAGWWTRHASPFTTALAEHAPLVALADRMIHDSRTGGYEIGRCPQCVRNFLGIRNGQILGLVLGARCERGEKKQ